MTRVRPRVAYVVIGAISSTSYILRFRILVRTSPVWYVIQGIVQLDWPWIAEWAYAGIFAVAARFQNQDQFWISRQRNQGLFFFRFSEKSKNELVRPKMMFWQILGKN